MAQQEEGWPLGLQPLNMRVGLAGNGNFSGSVSFNTLLTGSPTCSTGSSSDLDTESTGSFFHDKSITLGSLIGVSSILELSRKSARVRKVEVSKEGKKSKKSKTWLFSLCSRETTDAESRKNPPSLGHFLAAERKKNLQSPAIYGPEELSLAQPVPEEPNSLFVNGRVAPPRISSCDGSDAGRRRNGSGSEHGSGYGVQVLFSCMCGHCSPLGA